MEPSPPSRHTPDSLALRAAVAFIWLATGLGVMSPDYRTVGHKYLAPIGLPDWLMVVTCIAEIFLGLVILFGPASASVSAVQIILIVTFTAILGITYPRLLVDPFGVLSKNIPLIAFILAAWRLERESWTSRVEWLLRGGLAFIWIWEGLFVNILGQAPELHGVIGASGLPVGDIGVFLTLSGVGEVIGGLALLVLRGRLLRWLLILQAVGLVVITVLVSNYSLILWLNPFGPLTKNIPLIGGTLALARRV
jgi:uncharacterized membrane protein YphA (DoxX/SURF4 family)